MPNYKSKPYVLDLSIIVHIYSGALVIGDAYKIIDKLKDGNAYFDLFFDESKGGFTNEINEIKRNEIVNHFSLISDGGCWTPIFASGTNLGVLNYYIDYTSSILAPHFSRPKAFFSKSHNKILRQLLRESLKNKPLFQLSVPSNKLFFMEAGNDIKIQRKDHDFIKIDYQNKSNKEIFDQLFYEIRNNSEKIKFQNFECPIDDLTLDFYPDPLQRGTEKLSVYKVESLEKNLDWFSNYYAKYHTGEKNINKEKKVDKEGFKKFKNMSDENFKRLGIDPSLVDIEKVYRETPIKKFKNHIKEHGFLHGYILWEDL